MPTYDYRCSACGREVEVMHGINDRGPAACEACGGPMSKLLSPPAIHFKGSGWAKKDAAAAGSRASASAKESSATTAEKQGSSAGASDSAATTSTPAKDTGTAPSKPARSKAD